MMRIITCTVALAIVMFALKYGLHSIRWIGLPLYLLVCGSGIASFLALAYLIDRANMRSQPPEL